MKALHNASYARLGRAVLAVTCALGCELVGARDTLAQAPSAPGVQPNATVDRAEAGATPTAPDRPEPNPAQTPQADHAAGTTRQPAASDTMPTRLPPTTAAPPATSTQAPAGEPGPPGTPPPALPTPAATPDDVATASATATFEGDPFGNGPARLVAGPISLRVLLQARYADTFAEHSRNPRAGYALREDVLVSDGDGWRLRRFFFRIAADPAPTLRFKAVLDFAKLRGSSVSNVLKQAYVTLRPLPKHLEIAAGVFKLPYSILELDPIARFELAEVGAADDLVKNLGFAGRDVGAELMVAPLHKAKHLRFIVGAFRGHAQDEHASPIGAIGARVESHPFKGLRLGADVVGMPFAADYKQPFATSSKDVLPDPPDPLYPREQRWAAGKAYSADITFARHHLTLRAEGLLGDRVDVDERYGARSFWAAWGIVAYRFWVGPVRLLPAARLEWLDTDREHAVGRRRELSFALNVLLSKTLRLLFDVTRTDVQNATPVIEQPRPLPAYPYFDLDNTRVVVQLQAEL